MNCDCPECTRHQSWWESSPGPWLSWAIAGAGIALFLTWLWRWFTLPVIPGS